MTIDLSWVTGAVAVPVIALTFVFTFFALRWREERWLFFYRWLDNEEIADDIAARYRAQVPMWDWPKD